MKKKILIFALIMCVQGYSHKDFTKKEILLIEGISIVCDNKTIYIDVKTNKPLLTVLTVS